MTSHSARTLKRLGYLHAGFHFFGGPSQLISVANKKTTTTTTTTTTTVRKQAADGM